MVSFVSRAFLIKNMTTELVLRTRYRPAKIHDRDYYYASLSIFHLFPLKSSH